MRRFIAVVLLVCLVIPAFGQEDLRSTLYDKHLQITERGLLDTQKRILVLDMEALGTSLDRAQEYFELTRLQTRRATCGPVAVNLAPHYELRRAGRIYACVQLGSLPDFPPRHPTDISPGTIDHITFVGPLCDRVGACPGMLLTDIPKFAPLRDCGTAEGMVVCNPKYIEKRLMYYSIQSCNREFRGTNVDEIEVFKRKRGRFKLCSIDMF